MASARAIRRAGLLGDIHAEHDLLAIALAELTRAAVDVVLAVGDIVDGEGSVDESVALLRRARVLAVAGNHERWLAAGALRGLPHATRPEDLREDTLDYLRELPRTRTLTTALGAALLCHGMGDDDMAGLTPDDSGYALETNPALQTLLTDSAYRCVLAGHTHRRMVRRLGGVTFINAGTLARDGEPGYAIVDFASGHVEFRQWHGAAGFTAPEVFAL